MQITKAVISNFRNIDSLAVEFKNGINCIKGANHIGKTNVLQAIYWVLADSLIDNSSDFDSIVPTTNRRAVTHVQITFDNNHVFEKTYKEKWTRTRGSSIEKLTGHETGYIFNGIILKTKEEARRAIRTEVLGEKAVSSDTYPIDLAKALLNPLYLFGQETWQNARAFITMLVGKVTDADIFFKHPELEAISKDLADAGGRTEILSRKYKGDYSSINDSVKECETLIDNYQKKADENNVSETEVEQANGFIAEYMAKVEEIQNGTDDTNPLIGLYKNQIEDMRNKLLSLKEQEAADNQRLYSTYSQAKQVADNEYFEVLSKYNEEKARIQGRQSRLKLAEETVNTYQRKLDSADILLKDLRNQYAKKKTEEYTPHENTCPNCGYILNQSDIDKERKAFENSKNDALVSLVARGRDMATEVSRLEIELKKAQEGYDAEMAYDPEEAIKKLDKLQKEAEAKKEASDSIKPQKSELDEQVNQMSKQLTDLKNKLASEQQAVAFNHQQKLDEYIEANKDAYEKANAVKSSSAIHMDALKDLSKKRGEREQLLSQLALLDKKKVLLKQFIVTKLAMINESAKRLFPDIELVLVEDNIAEGSFSEVCYPLIIGKKTPFANGSNSERIITGIAIINDIRNFLEMDPVPVLFDEGETLDSNSLAFLANESKSQMIVTQVDQNPKDESITITSNFLN